MPGAGKIETGKELEDGPAESQGRVASSEPWGVQKGGRLSCVREPGSGRAAEDPGLSPSEGH